MSLDAPLNRPESDRPKVSIRKPPSGTLRNGDDLIFEIQTPPYESYVTVSYIQANGSVLNLLQPGQGLLTAQPANSKLVFGMGNGKGRFQVSEPFG
jgi:hypothetical protein